MKKFTLSLLLFTITFCTLIGLISNINIKAAETNDNFTVSMVDGAQIRTVEPNGIKFIGKVTGTVTGKDVKYGIVFGQGTVTDLTHETKDSVFAEVTSTTDGGEFYVTMIKFPESAYTMNITARAYVKVDGDYYYSDLSVTRNLGDLAVAYSKTDGYVAEENPLIENILSVLVKLDENKVLIEDLEDLKAFRDAVNAGDNHATKKVYLMNDIDLANEEWTPINNFAGTFDGQEHTISSLTSNLFGTVSGIIKYLNIKNVTIMNTAKNGANGFIGTLATGGLVDNCKISDVTITWIDTLKDVTDCWGGVISRVNEGATVQNSEFNNINVQSYGKMKRTGVVFAEVGGKISGCTIDGVTLIVTNEIKATATAYTDQVGGIIADLYDGAEVSGCTFNNVTMTIDLAQNTGGIIGKVGVGNGNPLGNKLENITVNTLVMNAGNTVRTGYTIKNIGGFIGQVDYRNAPGIFIMDNCHINGLDMTMLSNAAKEDPSAGFISSLNGNAQITNCSVDGKINGINEPIGIGGFLGTVGGYGAPATGYIINFTDCSADVAITGNDNIFVGGFVAHAGSYNQKINLTLTFTNCTATGDFYGTIAPDTNDNDTTETVNFNNN